MKELDQHSSPIKSPKQLIVVVALAFAIPIIVIVLLSQLITGSPQGEQESQQRILSRIKAVGTVAMTDASAPKGDLSGEAVYVQVCKTCHDPGLAGAPKTGDKSVWTSRLAQGQATVVAHAIAGYQGKGGVMPAKGGNPDLTDAEVERAVVHMANLSGGNWKSSAPPSSAAPPAPTPSAAAAAPPPVTVATAPAAAPAAPTGGGAAAADGKKVYDTACLVCHTAGIAGAPKLGDKSAWAPRLAEGANTLYTHAINGFQGKAGLMPAKGGNPSLSDADVKAAVDYMVSAAK